MCRPRLAIDAQKGGCAFPRRKCTKHLRETLVDEDTPLAAAFSPHVEATAVGIEVSGPKPNKLADAEAGRDEEQDRSRKSLLRKRPTWLEADAPRGCREAGSISPVHHAQAERHAARRAVTTLRYEPIIRNPAECGPGTVRVADGVVAGKERGRDWRLIRL